MSTHYPTLWLRSEHKPDEARTPITPTTAKTLLDAGYNVFVEKSTMRAFSNDAYAAQGCQLVEQFSWQQAPNDAIIVGLKELSTELGPFIHRHVHFAHVFKNQEGWSAFLKQFDLGGGTLYDLEYLTHENGQRVAAFGYWAGYVGAAVALLQWAAQRSGESLNALTPWSSREQLMQHVSAACQQVSDTLPTAMVIGAKGRSGRGAVELFTNCNIKTTQWDQNETAGGGPFDEVLQHDLLVNCVFLSDPIPPFTNSEHIRQDNRTLSVISDVSCDPNSDKNPLPIYSSCTNMRTPSIRIVGTAKNPLDLISIDHLPSLLPIESSEEYADALLPHLLQINALQQGVWQRAKSVFDQKLANAVDQA